MNFVTLILVHLFAVFSPGQTLISLINYALKGGARAAFQFLLGTIVINILFLWIAIFGLSEVIFKNKTFTFIFYILSALYLFYFSIKLFLEKPSDVIEANLPSHKTFLSGILIEVSNPKSVFFAAALTSIIITPESSIFFRYFIIFFLVSISIIYQSIIIFSILKFRSKLLSKLKIINKIFAVSLIIFAIRLILFGFNII